jgi:hypothetical protein
LNIEYTSLVVSDYLNSKKVKTVMFVLVILRLPPR